MVDSRSSSQLSDAEVLAAVASTTCAACSRVKSPGRPFCATDWAALPMPGRLALADIATSSFVDAFRSWLRHLELHSTRSQVFGRSYRSLAELEGAGYRFSRHAQCSSVRCLAEIVWLRTPRGRWLAVDPATWQPHSEVCRDTAWLDRRKARLAEARQQRRAQTSAKRRRAS